MKRIAILAAFALVAGVGVAMAYPCDGGNCVIDEPTVTTPPQGTPCNGSDVKGYFDSIDCARPEPVHPYHRGAERADAPAGHVRRQHRGED
jgi:hypothetical protein